MTISPTWPGNTLELSPVEGINRLSAMDAEAADLQALIDDPDGDAEMRIRRTSWTRCRRNARR